MPQIDIKNIELFHRDDYPVNTNKGRLTTPVETISIIIDPKLTAKENKVDDFFTIKPRRFEFAIRKSDYDFFNVDESPLTAHINYPNLSDYMIRVFDSADAVIFEGILSVESSYEYNSQTIGIIAYDPLVLIVDSDLSYTTANLQTSYSDPHGLAALLFGTGSTQVFGRYFTASSYYPDYDDSWVGYDHDLGAYLLLHDWGADISDFYGLAEGAWKNAADDYFDGLHSGAATTDVYDYSKLEVCRGNDFKSSAIFLFIGCIAYYDAVNDHSYVKVWWKGGYFSMADKLPHDLPENLDLATEVKTYDATNSEIDTTGHAICQYFSNRIYHGTYHTSQYPELMIDPAIYCESRDANIFDPIYWAKYFIDNTPHYINFLTPNQKAMIVLRDTFQWKPLILGSSIREYLGVAGDTDYGSETEFTHSNYYSELSYAFQVAFQLLNEGGEVQYGIDDYTITKDYLYNINNNCVIKTYDPPDTEIQILTSDDEDGLFDFWYFSSYQGWYKTYRFKIQYEAYPLTYSGLGLTDATKLHKIGNLSRRINALPTDVTYSNYYTGDAYDFKLPDTGETYATTSDLIQMLLATMNLYLYYDACTVKLIASNSVGSTVVIDDTDVIDWESSTGEKQFIDCSSEVELLDNYTSVLLNPFYNELAGLDNITASCKVSRLVNTYAIDLNSVITILNYNWRIEKISKYEAYYDLKLTKYLALPV